MVLPAAADASAAPVPLVVRVFGFVFLLVEDAVVEECLGGAQRGDSGWLHS